MMLSLAVQPRDRRLRATLIKWRAKQTGANNIMNEKNYNGWTNYETWLVKLWIDNDEGSQGYWQERAQAAYNEAESSETFTRTEEAALALDDELKAWHEEIAEGSGVPTSGFIADLFNSAMSEVNWYEIAASLIEDNVEEESEETEEAEA
jgi:hypothetical protein